MRNAWHWVVGGAIVAAAVAFAWGEGTAQAVMHDLPEVAAPAPPPSDTTQRIVALEARVEEQRVALNTTTTNLNATTAALGQVARANSFNEARLMLANSLGIVLPPATQMNLARAAAQRAQVAAKPKTAKKTTRRPVRRR